MMEFGGFDDDLFEEKVSADRTVDSAPYVPKCEGPQWYFDSADGAKLDADQLRLQAYHHYHNGDYQAALEKFSLLYGASESVRPMAESLESMARCCLQLEQFDQAELHGNEYLSRAKNYDNFVQGDYLMVDIYSRSEQHGRALGHLIRLLSQFDRNPQLWLRLQRTLQQCRSFEQSCRICPSCARWIQVGSLVRAKTLLDRTYRTAVGFSKERNGRDQERIDVQLNQLGCDDRESRRIRKLVAADLIKTDAEEQSEVTTEVTTDATFSLDMATVCRQFFQQWFNWTQCTSTQSLCDLSALNV